jgi:hypothetical protein
MDAQAEFHPMCYTRECGYFTSPHASALHLCDQQLERHFRSLRSGEGTTVCNAAGAACGGGAGGGGGATERFSWSVLGMLQTDSVDP